MTMKSICNIHEVGFDVAVGCHYCRGVAEEKAVEFEALEVGGDLREFVDDAGRRLANGHPFAGLSKLIDEVTEEGPETSPLTPRGEWLASLKPGDKVRINAEWSSRHDERAIVERDWGDGSYRVGNKDEQWSATFEAMYLEPIDESQLMPVEETLSEAITTYACGPLSPGERHEARVVASRGKLTVHHAGGRCPPNSISVRDPSTGHDLAAFVYWADADTSEISVPGHVGDVVIEFAVVAP